MQFSDPPKERTIIVFWRPCFRNSRQYSGPGRLQTRLFFWKSWKRRLQFCLKHITFPRRQRGFFMFQSRRRIFFRIHRTVEIERFFNAQNYHTVKKDVRQKVCPELFSNGMLFFWPPKTWVLKIPPYSGWTCFFVFIDGTAGFASHFLAPHRLYGGFSHFALGARTCPVTPWRRLSRHPQFDY